jgi:hypothetical protein
VLLLAEDTDSLALAAWQACEALAATIPKDEQAGHTAALKEALAGAREKERRKRRPGALQLHGLLLPPKALGPFVPIYLQGVLQVRLAGAGRVCRGGAAVLIKAGRLLAEKVQGVTGGILLTADAVTDVLMPAACGCAGVWCAA